MVQFTQIMHVFFLWDATTTAPPPLTRVYFRHSPPFKNVSKFNIKTFYHPLQPRTRTFFRNLKYSEIGMLTGI